MATGFQLQNGDIVIDNNEIQMISDAELTRQTVETVLNTNKGEWVFDDDEGINFSNILGKKSDLFEDNSEVIKSEVADGLSQVDDTFSIDDFNSSYDNSKRSLKVSFTAHNENGENIEVIDVWQD